MRRTRVSGSQWTGFAIFITFISVPFLVFVCQPGSNLVSAEVYSNEVGFIKADTVDGGVTLVSVPLVLLGDDPHYGLNNATLDGPGEIGLMLAADLVGGCFGALAAAGLLVPVLGIPQTCAAVALLNIGAAVTLLPPRR